MVALRATVTLTYMTPGFYGTFPGPPETFPGNIGSFPVLLLIEIFTSKTLNQSRVKYQYLHQKKSRNEPIYPARRRVRRSRKPVWGPRKHETGHKEGLRCTVLTQKMCELMCTKISIFLSKIVQETIQYSQQMSLEAQETSSPGVITGI